MRGPRAILLVSAAVLVMAGPAEAQDWKRDVPGSPQTASDPVIDRVTALRQAADLLEKAAQIRARGNRNQAEQLFSSAELIIGVEGLADVASLFREGAPPRITTPLKQLPMNTPPQPQVVGASDEDEPEARRARGSLAGTMQIEGRGGGAIGVVTLEPLGKKARRRSPKVRVMEQRDRQFAPRILAVPVGSTVTFPNFDQIFHNVFSISDAQKFDLGLYKGGQAREITFDREGIIRLGCNLHANMSAHVVVVGAPHYAVTDAQGAFRFRSLEPGKYRLRAWSERSTQPVTQEIQIAAGANKVAVGVKGDAPEGPPPDKFGVSRGKKP